MLDNDGMMSADTFEAVEKIPDEKGYRKCSLYVIACIATTCQQEKRLSTSSHPAQLKHRRRYFKI